MKRRLLTLFYEPAYGELLPISFGAEFEQESLVLQMDVLGDALVALNHAYDIAVEAWQASEKWRGNRDTH